jgi:hypothetical protein
MNDQDSYAGWADSQLAKGRRVYSEVDRTRTQNLGDVGNVRYAGGRVPGEGEDASTTE